MSNRLATCILALPLAACATGGGAIAPKVDLSPAREAVAAAREAGAEDRAPDALTRAQGHLNEAEALSTAGAAGQPEERARQAEALARLAVAEANCALEMSHAAGSEAVQRSASAASGAEVEKLQARLKKAEEEQHRLEDRVGLLQRDLEMTETEVIRSKARLKGAETKAGASSAIAEARILARRLDERRQPTTLARCNELIAKAEQLLQEENYGAAVFFALKAQDTAVKSQGTAPESAGAPESPAPKTRYVVRAQAANIRGGPGTGEAIVGRAPSGAELKASVVRGDWIKVSWGSVTGWVHRSLVE